MTPPQLLYLLDGFRTLDREAEWVEYKLNNVSPHDISEYISALSNSAALLGKEIAGIVWGIDNVTRQIVGTTFRPHQQKIQNCELEMWLSTHLEPRLDFRFHEFTAEGQPIVLLEIPACQHTPIRWRDVEYIRVGSYKHKLKDFPEKARSLWLQLSREPFESRSARSEVSGDVFWLYSIMMPTFASRNKTFRQPKRDCWNVLRWKN